MITNFKKMKSLIFLLGFILVAKNSSGQKNGYVDNLGVFRFSTYSDMVDSIYSYVENTSTTGTYVFAFETMKSCNSKKTKPYIKQFYSSYELTTLKREMVKSQKVSKQQVKNLKLLEVSEIDLRNIRELSYSDFIAKYVNLNNGVLYRIDNVKLLNAVLFQLLTYNISIYVTDNSGDYIISINQ